MADGLRLQAWREPQLAVLQEQLKEVDLLPQVARGLETARASSMLHFGTHHTRRV